MPGGGWFFNNRLLKNGYGYSEWFGELGITLKMLLKVIYTNFDVIIFVIYFAIEYNNFVINFVKL